MTTPTRKKPARAAAVTAAPPAESLLVEEIRRPTRDIDVYLRWARGLVVAAREHRAALLATPMTPEPDLTSAELADFERAVERLAAVQDEQELRQQATANLTPTQRRAYAAARAAQKAVVEAIRHAYRDDRSVRAWCAQVMLGVGVADLHEDTRKLRAFWDERGDALARFTAGREALDEMARHAAGLPELATPDAESDKRHTRLRNAAWTLVDRTATRLCTAGRFALRGDREERKRFRRPARKAKGKKK